MKKILLFLICAFICLSAYSQKIVSTSRYYDSYGNLYAKVRIFNNTRNTITCMFISVGYITRSFFDESIKTVKIRETIFPGRTKEIMFKIPETGNEPNVVHFDKAIFSNGKCKTFFN